MVLNSKIMSEFIKLSKWAADNEVEYRDAWKQVKSGVFPHKTKVSKTNRIWVESKANDKMKELTAISPMFAGEVKQSIASRRNRAATLERTDAFFHISNGIDPFQSGSRGGNKNDFINVNDAIRLTQKCYYNFSIFRSVIDVMTEFSSNKIFLREGNNKSRDFFGQIFKKINIVDLQEKFFREYYRSGNVFLYRFESIPQKEDISKLNKAYNTSVAKELILPAKYVILNPVDIVAGGNISFSSSQFYKILNGYEVDRLKNPKTKEDEDFLASLPSNIIETIKKSSTSAPQIPLDAKNVYAIFYKKQDYEPLSVPMGFPVLKDINYKEEMKEIDMAISRTTHRVILLVTMGYESKAGDYMVDAKTIAATQALFESESIGKVLVADFTTKAEFIVPPIADLLDPKKYEIVNEDIRMGLNNILVGKGEKFANQHIQVNLFVQRLIQAREVFLNQFLIPEMEKISKDMGFKNCPVPYFQDFDLKDEAEFNRIVIRLSEIGFLTPSETFDALETGRIPTKEESELSQVDYISLKKKGFYEPLLGGAETQKELADVTNKQQLKMQEKQHEMNKEMAKEEAKLAPKPVPGSPNIPKGPQTSGPAGRPSGTKRKQSTKKVSPIGKASLYSLSKIKDNLITANILLTDTKSKLLEKFKIKELSPEQSDFAESLTEAIMMNESIANWNKDSVEKYLKNPDQFNDEERYKSIQNLAYEHQVDNFLASVIFEGNKED
jgi:hypothetical protein